VLYVKAKLDGEIIKEAYPVLGYLHRGIEKLAENRYYHQGIPNLDRLDYLCGFMNELPYVMAVEKLNNIKVPERAEYIRVILGELTRITGHQMWVGSFLNDLGALYTPFLYQVRDREKLLDLQEEIGGQRMTPNYFRFGGVKDDVPDGWLKKLSEFCDYEENALIDHHKLIESEIFHYRTKGVGKITSKQAINMGITGPLLRSTGVSWDLRRDDPYSIYDRFDFNVITAKDGDLRAAYDVRMAEIEESIKIIRQAIKDIPEGPVCTKVPSPLRPDKGDVYAKIETNKGELGVYLVSDGSDKPYRVKYRAPCFCNLRIFEDIVVGGKVADLIVIGANIDLVMGDVDR
jgi:NADH-quinone oxidoreductase subunit D